jgi:hypothetical protein
VACLLTHLEQGMREPFRRPDADCCMWVADWVLAAAGIDPAAALRGSYGDARTAARQIRRFGSFEGMWRICMGWSGFATTTEPRDGDVGVVRDALGRPVAAIRTGGAWAAKTRGGVIIEDFPMLVAWSIARA